MELVRRRKVSNYVPKFTPESRFCVQCGSDFLAHSSKQKFCSRKCAHTYHNSALGSLGNISRGKAGAVSELRVCADLLQRGFEVFRSVSPACSCDLVLHRDGELRRVEVRTAYINPRTGNKLLMAADKSRYDIYAAVFFDKIEYFPNLEEIFRNRKPVEASQ